MRELHKLMKSADDYDNLCSKLIERVEANKAISTNAMRDGQIISFMMVYRIFMILLFLRKPLPKYFDGTWQILEMIIEWMTENESELIKIMQEG